MIRLTCLLARKPGMSPKDFHQHWKEIHGALIAQSRTGSHVLRYEQHPRPLGDYQGSHDPGFDGVTIQWFTSIKDYKAHLKESDFATIWADIEGFLDTSRLHFVLTEEPRIVFDRRADLFDSSPS